MNLNEYIDHTLLNLTASSKQIIELCNEDRKHQFFAICVHGSFVPLAVSELLNDEVNVADVIGFPLGAMSTRSNIYKTNE